MAIGDFLEALAYDTSQALENVQTQIGDKVYPFHEVTIDTPATITPTTTAKSVLTASPYKWCFSFIIRVRSMGTATYIRVGSYLQQNYTMIAKGQTVEFSGNPGEVVDLSKMYIISDTNDGVIEIIAAYVPLHLVGLVEQSVGRGF